VFVSVHEHRRCFMSSKRQSGQACAKSVSSRADDAPSGRLWLTVEQLATRYQISVRKIWYLAEDGTLPYYKCGHFTRFAWNECDLAMRAFRRASKFDSSIEEELTLRAERVAETVEESADIPSRFRNEPQEPGRPLQPTLGMAGEFPGERTRAKHAKRPEKRALRGTTSKLERKTSCRRTLVLFLRKSRQNIKACWN
jgi:hypothetical protein